MTTTALIAHEVLFRFNGEVSYTPADPMAPWKGQVDLSEKGTFILSNDDWRTVSGPLYEVNTVHLPSWLSVEEWICTSVQWKYTWGCGVDPSWSESWQRGLMGFDGVARRMAAVKLLKTKTFRSAFRKSLRDQLVVWLDTPAEERKYASPFSARQWEALVDQYTARDAKYLSESLYRDRNYRGVPMAA